MHTIHQILLMQVGKPTEGLRTQTSQKRKCERRETPWTTGFRMFLEANKLNKNISDNIITFQFDIYLRWTWRDSIACASYSFGFSSTRIEISFPCDSGACYFVHDHRKRSIKPKVFSCYMEPLCVDTKQLQTKHVNCKPGFGLRSRDRNNWECHETPMDLISQSLAGRGNHAERGQKYWGKVWFTGPE